MSDFGVVRIIFMVDPGTDVSGSRPNNDLQKDCDPAAKP